MPSPLRRRAWLAALAAALAPVLTRGDSATAAPETLAGRGLVVEVALRGTSFHYAEFGATGAFLDGETGFVPQLAAALELRTGVLCLRGAAAIGAAALDYAGHVQSPSVSTDGLPLAARSDARLRTVEGQVGLELPRARGITVVAGAADRRWERDIRDSTVVSRAGAVVAVGGLSEAYAWTELHAGVRAPLVRAPAFAWEAEARVTWTVDPTFAVAWNGRDVRLPLAARTGYALGSTIRAALGRVVFLRAAFSFERFDFGASPRDRVTGLLEPDSETRAASLDVGLGARF